MPACGCRRYCGDLPEEDDDDYAVCQGLPVVPPPPDVEIVVMPRAFRDTDQPKET